MDIVVGAEVGLWVGLFEDGKSTFQGFSWCECGVAGALGVSTVVERTSRGHLCVQLDHQLLHTLASGGDDDDAIFSRTCVSWREGVGMEEGWG